MKLHELREQRAAKVAEMRGLVTAAETAGRDLADNERTRFDGLKAEVTGLDRRIGEGEVLADLERRAEAEPITPHGEMLNIEARYSLAKALAEHNETGRLSGLEAEWAAEHRSGRKGAFAAPVSAILGTERRSVTTGGSGGNLVATMTQPTGDRIRPTLAVEQLGATVLSGLIGNLDLPRLSSSGSASWVAEDGNATRTDPTFAKTEMSPKTAAAEYRVSRRMLLQSQPALEVLLRNDLGYLMREALDHAAIVGGGANQPTGLLAAATGISIISAGTNGAAFGLDLAADLISAIPDGVAGLRGFLTNAKVRGAAMKLKDSQARPYGLPAVFQGETVKYSDSVPANLTKGTGAGLSAVVYGAWQDLVVGYWSAVDILANPFHSDVASNGGLLLHCFLDCDVAVRHPESFAAAKDVVTQ